MNEVFGRHWTTTEEATLRRLARRVHRNEIATLLNRSPSAVQARANKLSIPLDLRKWIRPERDPDTGTWTEADKLAAWADIPQELAELVITICSQHRLAVKDVRADNRSHEHVKCRWEIALIARQMHFPYMVIGRALNRDHTTIIHAIRQSSTTTNKTGERSHQTPWRVVASEGIYCPMEQDKNRRAAA